MTLNVLSLFSGIGGLELGLERAGMRTVGQVEIDDYCRRVLAKHWPDVPRHDDVRTAADWWLSKERPRVDVICGGFPCQDISAAGRRAGIVNGERSGLWSWFAHIIREIRPRYVLVENVPRVLVRGRDGVIPAEVVAADLAALGYDLRWDCVSAASVGAPHLRDRWFGVAYSDGFELRQQPVTEQRGSRSAVAGDNGAAQPLADAEGGRRQDQPFGSNGDPATGADGHQRGARLVASDVAYSDRAGLTDIQGWPTFSECPGVGAVDSSGWWRAEPDVGRVVDGLSSRMDRSHRRARVHALGNAVVPQVAEYVGRLIVAHAEQVAA